MFATAMPLVTTLKARITALANQDFMETEKQAAKVNHYDLVVSLDVYKY